MSANTARADQPDTSARSDQRIRMAVAWQHPIERGVCPVGLLEFDGVVHRFRYLRTAPAVRDFRPFVGFPSLTECYESALLFPLFAQRAMNPRRPDYTEHLRTLDLGEDATTWEQLARTEGRIAGDTIVLIPEPTVVPSGETWGQFLVAGIRHRLPDPVERDKVLGMLQRGEQLMLIDEPNNPVNPRAILTTTNAGVAVGWVPDLLLDYVHTLKGSGAPQVAVVHTNGPDAPIHMRLLVEIRGTVAPSYRPFGGPRWETFCA